MSEYAEHVGSKVTIATTYGMIYSAVELVAATDEAVTVRVSTKVESKTYEIAAGRIKKLTVLGRTPTYA